MSNVSEYELWTYSVVGLVCIVLLSWAITKQLRALKQENNARRELRLKEAERRKFLLDSVYVLCKSVLDKQVEISEACMRVKLLIDHFDSTLHERHDFKVFNDVYDRLEHMPRFEARKRLSRREMNALDQERYEVEAEYEDEVKKACVALLAHLSSLH
ncbi:hypothetical protein A3762_02010 [Oleiphilus sp. HI0125]|uniref:DUF2489 domain-containing protein n=1 Tax=Oleiphilus sp. HI0125 TaxID=1822266 RepID=UPI0007C31882|nr:DUF2489 domain-containing protein [Oleiphilus sp. HI0125]KZZ62139.1 hypothetical protein A3762_02010 [Oleiphilus sp. HI0125]